MFEKAAEKAHPEAHLRIAQMFERGDGLAQNMDEAERFYRRAAELGDKQAQYDIAMRYRNGNGVPQNLADLQNGWKWLQNWAT